MARRRLYRGEVAGRPPACVERTFMRGRNLAPDVDAFARSLFSGTVSEVAALDLTIAGPAEHWGMERMPAIDRNILRMALDEVIMNPETPGAVVINEALELARRFGGADSVEFVNGVLDAIWKSLPQAQPKA